jgi:hypothetical protein
MVGRRVQVGSAGADTAARRARVAWQVAQAWVAPRAMPVALLERSEAPPGPWVGMRAVRVAPPERLAAPVERPGRPEQEAPAGRRARPGAPRAPPVAQEAG